MPSVKQIKDEWENKFAFIGDFGWEELPTNACWRCGEEGPVEKAHIWARNKMLEFTDKTSEEIDSPSNLHLLCKPCHKFSELISGWAPGLAYYEWFYTIREDVTNVPDLPQVFQENRFYKMKLMKVMSDELGIDTTVDRKPTDKEMNKVAKWYRNFLDNGDITGKTILYKETYEKYLKLPKDKQELACIEPLILDM